MKIALLGYGKEGQAAEKYFAKKGATFDIFENLTHEEFCAIDYSPYDIILRSPSVKPLPNLPQLSSLTKYFFEKCPCPIIGVTATKGKGTTCSFIKALLDAHGEDAHLVGNIGTPAIEVLDQLTSNSVVVSEMSSFQLWDLTKSPHVSVVGTIEPDHLNVHNGFDDYINAKSNIAKHQTPEDFIVYYSKNPDSVEIAKQSAGRKIAYPFTVPEDILSSIKLPGRHNQENAIAAIAAVASFYNISPDEYCKKSPEVIRRGLESFTGLPHRLEFVRKIKKIRFYDDNFSTNPASTRVAIESFPGDDIILIAGGRDKTENQDLPEIYSTITRPNIKKAILIGESGHEISRRYHDPRFEVAESLAEAVRLAVSVAESYENPVVLMSPSAASFDMFRDVYDRGEQYQEIVKHLCYN